ncbi:MAG: HK97 family phage prohead protease, partial [Acidobacteria bacterium]|nr:HK97 family phage prohead protease [Acidobacteriota bacterium]
MSVRAVDDGQDGHRLEGKGVPFNDLSEDLGGFRERISPEAFDLDHTIKSFWSHDSSLVLGSTKVDTLKLEKRAEGIHFSLDLPDTTIGRDAFESIQRGDVDGVSFGFFAHEDRIDVIDGEVIRTVLRGELIEISPVAFPAFSQT